MPCAPAQGPPLRDLVPSARQDYRLMSLAAVGLLVVVAAWLRLHNLGEQSLWFDEAATWSQVSGNFYKLLSDTLSDNYPPLYNVLTWLLVQVFGDPEWVLRLPAALLGIATVPLIYLLGERLGGRWTGLIAALLLTLSGFHIWYSQEARMYSLLAFAATLHTWMLLRYLDRQSPGRRNAMIATGAILLFSHPYGPLTWLCLGAGAMLAPPRPAAGAPVRKLIKHHLISVAFFFPWGVALLVNAVEITIQGFWIPTPTPPYVWTQVQLLTGNLLLPLAALATLAVIRPSRLPSALRLALPMLLLWLLGPIILGLLASVLIKPVFVARYIIGSLPALFLLAAYGITRWLPSSAAVAAAAVACAAAAATSLALASPPMREDWRSAVAEVEAALAPQDCVMVLPGYNGVTWDYYHRDRQACMLWNVEQLSDYKLAPTGAKLLVLAGGGAFDREELDAAFADQLPAPTVTSFWAITTYVYPSSAP